MNPTRSDLPETCAACTCLDEDFCAGCARRLLGEPAAAVIVRQGKYPVHFHTNLCGKVYSLVAEKEASRFSSPAAARARAQAHGLRPDQYSLEAAA